MKRISVNGALDSNLDFHISFLKIGQKLTELRELEEMQSTMKSVKSFNFSYYMHTSLLKKAYLCVRLLSSHANQSFRMFQDVSFTVPAK